MSRRSEPQPPLVPSTAAGGRPPCRSLYLRLIIGGALIAMAGCEGKPELAQVSGRVLLEGRPLANVQVEFVPDAPRKHALPLSMGATDASGHYRLQTADGRPGVVHGEHLVLVRDLELPGGGRMGGRAEAERAPVGQPPGPTLTVPRLPTIYSNAADTPLRQTVASGEQVIDIELRGAR